ncbi:MAG: hypothetical protein HFH04_11430 [Dorea sp.]|jgi:hypothetical protein|nr:hypothetical protein [Dorea sp.]
MVKDIINSNETILPNSKELEAFGYRFVWTMTEELKMNLARLKGTEKNLRINFEHLRLFWKR